MSDFERVKQASDIRRVILQETNLKMKGHHLEKCPFCEGHECFSIMADQRQGFKCHQCGEGGDVFIFLEKYLNLDRAAALRRAAEFASIELAPPKQSSAVNMTVKERIFRDAAEYYHTSMLENGGREYYVDARGHDERLLKEMRLGYADGRLTAHLKARGYTEDDIVHSGLAKRVDAGERKTVRDFFAKGLAIFPHFDARGRVVHFTLKDPKKKLAYQLPNAARDRDWRFYNQRAMRADEVVLVEGENDLLAVMSAGFRDVMAVIGQVSELQVKALQDHMRHKDLYLWFDKDKAGREYAEKVCRALRAAAYGVKVVEHPGEAKDPDEYLKAVEGDRRAALRRLLEGALDYISWQIRLIGETEDLGKRLNQLKDRKIFSSVASMPRLERAVFIDRLVGLGFARDDIVDHLEVNRELREAIAYLSKEGGVQKADVHELVRVIYEHFEANGKFFRDREHNVYLLYQNFIYTVGNNRPFNALMDKSSGLLCNRQPGQSVWEALANKGYNNGKRIDIASWMAVDPKRDAVYVNFNSTENTILRISAEGIREVPNGLNEDDVLLKTSAKIKPMEYMDGVSIREGLEAMKELVMDNFTCDVEQRYLVICWFISAFLLDFLPYQALMKFSGNTKSGKTTAAKLLSMLLYGQKELGHISSAAAYSLAAQNPLVIMDNLEEHDRTKSIKMFLLLTATGGSKEKRAGGTDSDTVQEKPKSLVLITSIESMEEPELINRTFDIEFHKKHRNDGFIENEVLWSIGKRREEMMSAVLKFVHAEILPNRAKGLGEYLSILRKEYRGHSKDRADEYMALLMLILEKILPHMPLYKDDFVETSVVANEIWNAWIGYQNRQARDDETEGNTILRMLDGLANEYLYRMRGLNYEEVAAKYGLGESYCATYTHDDYLLMAVKTQDELITPPKGEPYHQAYFQFNCTSGEMVTAMDRWCREKSTRNPYSNAARFTKRLKNDLSTLGRGMWEVIGKEELGGLYNRVVHGQRFILFRKTLVR